MFKVIIKNFLLVILISIINKQAIAISGEEISTKVSEWLIKEGIKGTPRGTISVQSVEGEGTTFKVVLENIPHND